MKHLAGAARLLLALLGLFMAAAAMATSGTRIDSGLPPVRFQGDAVVTIHFQKQLPQTMCGTVATGYTLLGCVPVVGVPDAWVPNPCNAEYAGQSYATIVCHELGHVNGWLATHPRP